jgi:uncharacterized protein YggT (Ycf19 family)
MYAHDALGAGSSLTPGGPVADAVVRPSSGARSRGRLRHRIAARRRLCQLLGAMLLLRLLDIYSVILFVSVILSWTGLAYDYPIMRVARALTEPLLAPIRRVLPTMGGIDFSPMLLIVLINVLRRLLAH